MKKLLLLISVFAVSIFAYSQDIIVKINGEHIEAKVSEVGSDYIKYKAYDNLEGPLYNIPKSEVSSITYFNGSVDTFQKQSNLLPDQGTLSSATAKPKSTSTSTYKTNPQGGSDKSPSASASKKGLENEMELSVLFNVAPDANLQGALVTSLGFNYIGGYRFNDYVLAGLGVGFNYTLSSDVYRGYEVFTMSQYNMPIFARIKANMLSGPISPYIKLDGGGTFYFYDNYYSYWYPTYTYTIFSLGAFVSPSIGVDFSIRNIFDISIACTYKMNYRSITLNEFGDLQSYQHFIGATLSFVF